MHEENKDREREILIRLRIVKGSALCSYVSEKNSQAWTGVSMQMIR